MPGSIEADTPGPSGLGFAGLGAMGFGMVSNLLRKGFHVRGFDVSPNALERLSKIAGTPCTSCSEAAHGQNKFFIMVATPAQADSVIFGSSGIVESLPERAIICLFSTVPPSYITSLPQRLKAAGRGDLRVLDCPVSGGFVGAASGELSVSASFHSIMVSQPPPNSLSHRS